MDVKTTVAKLIDLLRRVVAWGVQILGSWVRIQFGAMKICPSVFCAYVVRSLATSCEAEKNDDCSNQCIILLTIKQQHTS
jgi:hypothetical protein